MSQASISVQIDIANRANRTLNPSTPIVQVPGCFPIYILTRDCLVSESTTFYRKSSSHNNVYKLIHSLYCRLMILLLTIKQCCNQDFLVAEVNRNKPSKDSKQAEANIPVNLFFSHSFNSFLGFSFPFVLNAGELTNLYYTPWEKKKKNQPS